MDGRSQRSRLLCGRLFPPTTFCLSLLVDESRWKQLFGASAVTKEYLLGVSDYSKATWTQNFIASIAGAVSSITVAAPLDTIKTRIQNADFEQKTRGVTIVRDLLRDEGATALFKGLTPKVCQNH